MARLICRLRGHEGITVRLVAHSLVPDARGDRVACRRCQCVVWGRS